MQSFGAGILYGTPLVDANGNAISSATPLKTSILQDFSLDISVDAKMLYGENKLAVDVGGGKAKVTGKGKSARIFGKALSLILGQPVTAGSTAIINDTIGQIVPSTLSVVATPPNSGTYAGDLGVQGLGGLPMTRITSPTVITLTGGGGSGGILLATVNPTTGAITGYTVGAPGTGYTTAPTAAIAGAGTGATAPTVTVSGGAITGASGGAAGTGYVGSLTTQQYAASAGTYSFAAVDIGTKFNWSYRYTLTTGTTQQLLNTPMGPIVLWKLEYQGMKSGKFWYVSLNNVYSNKLSIASKLDDFTIPEFDVEALDDGTGTAGFISCSD